MTENPPQWDPQQPGATQPYQGPPAYQGAPSSLSQPLYGASFPQAVRRFFTKYAVFSGRASRSEYWWVALFNAIVMTVLGALTGVLGSIGATSTPYGGTEPGPGAAVGGILLFLWMLAVIVPSIALGVRRLHDAGFSGWLMLLGLLPSLGGLILLIFSLLPSSPAGQRYDASR